MRNTVELRKTKTDDKLKRLRNIHDGSDAVSEHVGGADGGAAQLDVSPFPAWILHSIPLHSLLFRNFLSTFRCSAS